MQLSLLSTILAELRLAGSLHLSVSAVDTYHYWSTQWFVNGDSPISDTSLTSTLTQALSLSGPSRPPRSVHGYFPIGLPGVLIGLTFSKGPRAATLQRAAKDIARCVTHATNAFNARHDRMTGLLNKEALDLAVQAAVAEPIVQTSDPSQLSHTLHAPCVAALAFDLDHFKRINDAYGHLYGDVVLKSFSRRLQTTVATFAKEEHLLSHVGRPGGEEFLVVLRGHILPTHLTELAARLRRAVGTETPLPSDDEWPQVGREAASAGIVLPPPVERRVTVSIGTATCPTGLVDTATASTEAVRLVRQADIALYCAKAGGRDTVRHFDDILQKHGRLLEHHTDTGIVAIDIGSNVTVTRGQEFRVFHPVFDGTTPFVFADGRTNKRLGTYPRHSCGRIVVFDVQLDISFCKVLENTSASSFVPGSYLEAVPLGTISHILEADPIFSDPAHPSITKYEDLIAAVHTIVDKSQTPFAAVFTIDKLTDVMRARGSAFVNTSLAHLYSSVRDAFPREASVGQLQTGEICVVSAMPSDTGMETVNRAIAGAEKGHWTGVDFVAGVFAGPQQNGQPAPGDHTVYDLRRAVEFARFAASQEGRNTLKVCMFSPFIAYGVVVHHSIARRHLQALADYKTFVEMGVRFSALENQASVCYFDKDTPDYANALAAVERAIALLPDDPMLLANKAIVTFVLGDYLAATESITRSAEVSKGTFVVPENYRAALAVAVAEVALKHRSAVLIEEARGALASAMALPPNKHLFMADAGRLVALSKELAAASADIAGKKEGTSLPSTTEQP